MSSSRAYKKYIFSTIQWQLRPWWKKVTIASCESCPSRRRRCYIIPGLVLRQCATSQDTSENSTPYNVVRTVCMSSSYCTIQLYYRGRPLCSKYRTLIYVHTSTRILVGFTATGSLAYWHCRRMIPSSNDTKRQSIVVQYSQILTKVIPDGLETKHVTG